MLSPRVKYLSQHLFVICILFIIFFFYGLVTFGPLQGILIGCMTWSWYILSFPAAHGHYIFGSMAKFIGIKRWRFEPYMILSALLFNIVAFIIFRPLYFKTFFTRHLFLIITKPNPYWLMMIISSLGTLYHYLVGDEQYYAYYKYHRNIRFLLILFGIFSFFYLSWYDLVILLNEAF